jgi:hypothetical protein
VGAGGCGLTAYSSLVLRSFTRRPVIVTSVEAGQWDRVIDYVNREAFDKPSEFYTLDKLRKTAALDRTLSLREIWRRCLA